MSIPFGQPNELISRTREFKKGKLRLTVTPRTPPGLAVYCFNQLRGTYDPRLPAELYEGKHTLELRAPAMKQSVEFEVEIKPNQITDRTVDITSGL